MLLNYCNFDETLWILIWAPLWGSPCVWEVFESWIDCSCFIYIMYCLVKRDREIWSLHKLSLPETNVSDVWIGKLLFYRIFSNLLVARLTSHKIIKRLFNTKILSFIRALNFSHCDWRAWNVPSYWIWGKIRTHVKLINVFFLLSNNLQQYLDKYSCLSRQGINCHNFINFIHFQSKIIKVFVNTCIRGKGGSDRWI